jgi:hypothetical protein
LTFGVGYYLVLWGILPIIGCLAAPDPFYSLDDSSFICCNNQKYLQRLPNISLAATSLFIESYYSKRFYFCDSYTNQTIILEFTAPDVFVSLHASGIPEITFRFDDSPGEYLKHST